MAAPDHIASRSDAELLALALAGDETAFLLLYEKLKLNIFRYAFFMTNSRFAAEEVTQEVFLLLLKEGRNYRPSRGEVAGFAFGIARNLIRRIERERTHQTLSEIGVLEKLPANAHPDPEILSARIIHNELVEKLEAALASLPDHYRQVVVLCDLCELTYSDAASELGCAVGTVRSRLNRAHTLLAQKLKPQKGTQPNLRAAGPEGCVI